MRLRLIVSLFVSLMLCAGSARAQEKGDIGLVATSSSSVGIIWHATSRLAFDTGVSLSKSSSSSSSGSISNNSDTWGFGVDLSVRFQLARKDDLITYVAPAFSYDWARTSSVMTGLGLGGGTTTTNTAASDTLGGILSIGLQYVLSSRFSIFGESGVDYRRTNSPGSSTVQGHSDRWGSRSRIGIAFYF